MSLYYLIEKLDREKFRPVVLFLGNTGDAIDFYRGKNIEVITTDRISFYPHAENGWISLRSERAWEMVTRLVQIIPSVKAAKKIIHSIGPDLVHINTSFPLAVGIAARQLGIPVVWHIREPIVRGYLGLRKKMVVKIISNNASHIIAISRNDASSLGPIERPQITVVYNFVDFARFDHTLTSGVFRKRFSIPERAPVVVMLGGIVHSKGANVFLKAAEIVAKRISNVYFIVAGRPPELKYSHSPIKRIVRRSLEKVGLLKNMSLSVRRIVDNSKLLQERVFFSGMITNIPELLADADLLVWPAKVSHFARPILEAWAMKKPIVASNFSSSRELIQDGMNGYLVPFNEPAAFAEKICSLLKNPAKAEQFATSGYDFALKAFNANVNADKVFKVYDTLLKNAG